VRVDVEQLRLESRQRASRRPTGPELHLVRDLTVPGAVPLPARHYQPAAGTRPLLVFLHGGMWIMGDLDTHDRTCRMLASAADVCVLAVAYRRAPEHPWPAAVHDSISAIRWAMDSWHHPVGVGGDSAGGCLAALACQRLLEAGQQPPAVQALAYPNTDLTFSHASACQSGENEGLDMNLVRWCAEAWAPDPAVRADGRASPLHARDLQGLPPTLIVTAEQDPLRDEGDDYARALELADVPVRHRCEAGLPHGFLQGMDLVDPAAARAAQRFYADVGRLMGEEQHWSHRPTRRRH
jgi:acetyl esterase/lipase